MKENDEEKSKNNFSGNRNYQNQSFASKSKKELTKKKKTVMSFIWNAQIKAGIIWNKPYAAGNLKLGFAVRINGKNQRKSNKIQIT